MTTTDHVIAELDELSSAGPDRFDDELADRVERLTAEIEEGDLGDVQAALVARLPERGVHPPLHYCVAKLAQRRGDRAMAADMVGRIVERLNQNGRFPEVVGLLTRVIDLAPREVAVPMLVRAFRETKGEATPLDTVREWRQQFPEDRRLIWLEGMLEQAAGDADAVPHLAEVLGFLVREIEPAELEEAALPVVESLSADSSPGVVDMIKALATARRYEEAATYLDLCEAELHEYGQAGTLWAILSPLLAAEREAKRMRSPAVRALRAAHADEEHYGEMIDRAGLADRGTKFPVALKRFKALTRFPIGGYVEHTAWGVGKVLDADDERLVLRFADRPNHEMKRSLAEHALDRRDPEDLRVLSTFFSDRVAEFKENDPPALVAAALHTLGGSGKPRDLRRVLTADTIAVGSWPTWWKKARTKLEEDERFDLSETFQDIYKLSDPSEAGDAVLRIDDKEEPLRQIKLLRRFLEQHPQTRQRTVNAYTRRLDRWLMKRRLTNAERLLVRIVLRDWHPEREPELIEELLTACEAGFDIADLTNPADQELVIDLGLANERWRPVALSALSARVNPIRQRARATIEERLDEPEARALYASILEGSPLRGDGVLEVVNGYVEQRTPAMAAQSIVDVFLATLHLVSDPDRDAVRNRALKLLSVHGPIFTRLAAHEPARSDIDSVAMGLLSFRASDAFLNPILDSLETAWGSEPLEALRRRRQHESAKIAARMDDGSGFPTVLFMSRASFDELEGEIERVDRELRTSIPRAIQKAREHGDLRENAEYDAAKLKQRQYNDRLAKLSDRLSQAAVIEEASIDGKEVFVGTEVTVESLDGDNGRTYWVLGYDDTKHGDNVVSFQSETGRALWRRRVGDEIDLPGEHGTQAMRVTHIHVKMPPALTLVDDAEHVVGRPDAAPAP